MKKIMVYCQYLAGMGHLVRSAEIIRSLVKDFRVCFVNGGQLVSQFELPPEVETVYLPALREEAGILKPLDETQSLEAIKAERTQKLLAVFEQFQPDCLMTECFPFSKAKVEFELIPLLDRVQASPRQIPIICSLRDLIMTQVMTDKVRAKKEARVIRLINQYYHGVLFHADGNFQRLQDSFSQVEALTCEIIDTGYVAQSPPKVLPLTAEDIAGLNHPSPIIVVSAGGGRHGYPLLNAVIAASPRLADTLPHQIYAFAGPFMPAEDFAELQRVAADKSNVILRRYTSRLIDFLHKAELSISLGGYNTTMNLLRTGVRSLILPSPAKNQADEQRMRAEKLAQLGVLDLIESSDLAPEPLIQAITTRLNYPPTDYRFNLQGAENTAHYLQMLLAKPVLETVEPKLSQINHRVMTHLS